MTATELGRLLTGYARRNAAAADPHESVSATVSRCAVFTNAVRSASGHRWTLDEPASFGGTGANPDPAEALLAAVGASISVTITAHAAMRGLSLDAVEVRLAARIDGRGFFAPRLYPGRAGLRDITVEIAVRSALTPRVLRPVFADALRAAPVLRSLRRRPRVKLIHHRTGK